MVDEDFEFNFKHSLYEYIGCARAYHNEGNNQHLIRACRQVVITRLEIIATGDVEISDWFTREKARELLQSSSFDWTDKDKFLPWFEDFFNKYKIAIRTGRQ